MSEHWLKGLFGPVVALCLLMAPSAHALDLAAMSPQDIGSLQRRLADAKCYAGPIDGTRSSALDEALTRCPSMEPMLTIETGMHVAPIRRIGVDRACRLLATGSHDKTVRLWSLPDGRLLRTLRLPVEPGEGGRATAVALSADGRIVAAGGWDAHEKRGDTHGIYLFDAASGAQTARIGAFAHRVRRIAFSADDRYLAVLLGGDQGLRVLEVSSGREVAADRDHGPDGYGVVFAADGRLFTTSFDGALRAYDSNFRLTRKVDMLGSKRPFGIALDPSGERLAVGFEDSLQIEVYSTVDLGLLLEADTDGLARGSLSHVSWSADGKRLLAAGAFSSGGFPVVLWEDGGLGDRRTVSVASSTISDILPCGAGHVIGANEPFWAQLGANGERLTGRNGVTADMRVKRIGGLLVSADGARVRFGLGLSDRDPVLFDLKAATLTAGGSLADLGRPRIDGIEVSDWADRVDPKLAGKAIRLQRDERSRSLAVTPYAASFVLGTDLRLRGYDRSGRELWQKPAPATAYGVNLARDGRVVVAAYGDGTIRWHRMSDGQELLALFVHKEDKRWVAWTPSGYYQASPGGEDLFGWHLNRGWDQAADFFPASRLRERFSRPDIVQLVLTTLDEGKAIEEANRQANLRTDTSWVATRLPPVIRIVSPAGGARVQEREVTIEYELRSPSGLPVDFVEVQIDGRPAHGFKRTDPALVGAQIERQVISIPAQDVTIGLVARSGTLASDVASVALKWDGAGDELLKPKLYGVLVGVSNYKDASLKLKYAAKDAQDFAAALRAQQGGLYREVELKVLTDADATTSEVRRALTWLERNVTSRDVGLVFLAGHGITDMKNRYYYLTSDADPKQPEDSAFEGAMLRERARAVSGKMLVFLDTCYSGQATTTRGATDINAVINELSSTENGIVTYASSTGRQLSQEDDNWGNGAFTKALIEGLPAGRADLADRGVITTAALDLWLAERVKELTRGSQSPVMSRPQTIPDFPLFVASSQGQ